VLSHSVAAGISTHVSLGGMPDEALHTATFIDKFDKLYELYIKLRRFSKDTGNWGRITEVELLKLGIYRINTNIYNPIIIPSRFDFREGKKGINIVIKHEINFNRYLYMRYVDVENFRRAYENKLVNQRREVVKNLIMNEIIKYINYSIYGYLRYLTNFISNPLKFEHNVGKLAGILRKLGRLEEIISSVNNSIYDIDERANIHRTIKGIRNVKELLDYISSLYNWLEGSFNKFMINIEDRGGNKAIVDFISRLFEFYREIYKYDVIVNLFIARFLLVGISNSEISNIGILKKILNIRNFLVNKLQQGRGNSKDSNYIEKIEMIVFIDFILPIFVAMVYMELLFWEIGGGISI